MQTIVHAAPDARLSSPWSDGLRRLTPPSGQRRSTPANRWASAIADSWTGLPEGMTRWRVMAALRAAARALDLSSAMLRLLEHYVDLSYDQDWAPDSEPVICRPLAEIAEHMGRSERQVRNIERALVERGLLAFRDSGNHVRRGRRDRRTGRLVYAYGPSLAPLGVRANEIIAKAATARANIAEGRRLRLAISAMRRRLLADLAAAAAVGVGTNDLRIEMEAKPTRLPAAISLDELRRIRADLAGLEDRVSERLGGPCPDLEPQASAVDEPEISGQEEIPTPPDTDTFNKNTTSGCSIAKTSRRDPTAHPDSASAPRPRLNHSKHKQDQRGGGQNDNGVSSVPLAVALSASGEDMERLTRIDGPATWKSLIEAARLTAHGLGIDQALWGETCARLGRGGAALAVIILERGAMRPLDRITGVTPIRQPAAYLKELLNRAEIGTLHLDRSIRALAAGGPGVRQENSLARAAGATDRNTDNDVRPFHHG